MHNIQDAKGEFYGTPAHAQIIIVDADLALRRGDVQAALMLLKVHMYILYICIFSYIYIFIFSYIYAMYTYIYAPWR